TGGAKRSCAAWRRTPTRATPTRSLQACEQLRLRDARRDRHGAFAERARDELLATGGQVRKRTVETRDELTAQEEQIARLARDGLSNPEIGAPAVPQPAHGRIAPEEGVHQTRDQITRPGDLTRGLPGREHTRPGARFKSHRHLLRQEQERHALSNEGAASQAQSSYTFTL